MTNQDHEGYARFHLGELANTDRAAFWRAIAASMGPVLEADLAEIRAEWEADPRNRPWDDEDTSRFWSSSFDFLWEACEDALEQGSAK